MFDGSCCNSFTRHVASVVALEGRSEADLLTLLAETPQLAKLDALDESAAAGVSGQVNGHAIAIGNAAYFAALGLSIQPLRDWPDRIRRHGQHVLFVAVDGRTVGFLGVQAI